MKERALEAFEALRSLLAGQCLVDKGMELLLFPAM